METPWIVHAQTQRFEPIQKQTVVVHIYRITNPKIYLMELGECNRVILLINCILMYELMGNFYSKIQRQLLISYRLQHKIVTAGP